MAHFIGHGFMVCQVVHVARFDGCVRHDVSDYITHILGLHAKIGWGKDIPVLLHLLGFKVEQVVRHLRIRYLTYTPAHTQIPFGRTVCSLAYVNPEVAAAIGYYITYLHITVKAGGGIGNPIQYGQDNVAGKSRNHILSIVELLNTFLHGGQPGGIGLDGMEFTGHAGKG